MPEFTYDPSTGSGVEVSRGGQQPAEPSIQENANLRQSIAFRNTAEHLTERALQKKGNDVTQVGGGNVDAEIRLQETQKELADMSSGRIPFNALRQLQLESQCNTLAQYLVSGQTPPSVEDGTAPAPEVPQVEEKLKEEEDRIDELNDLRDTLRNDDTLTSALDWANDTLDESVTKAIRLRLNNENPDQLKQGTDLVKTLYNNRESIQTVESNTEVGELSDTHLQYFESNFGAETARNIALINHGIRTGKLTMGQATSQSLKLGILQPMLQAARELDDFHIANF